MLSAPESMSEPVCGNLFNKNTMYLINKKASVCEQVCARLFL